ncbi:BspA family leucine-rich repeat surface protein, partial [Lactobacillus sp.]|uniref:BspA family leucine-rich repeat surface protein n=1 Tax=Lactobacillus sp. TaxID=1591 RepID=UPI002590E78B
QTAIAKAATTPELIDQGTWGTSKWEYKHEGDDYVLYLHAGTLGESKWINSDFVYNGILQLNSTFKDQLTKIKIDQGVVANQESGGLFYGLSKLTTIEGLSDLDTASVTNMRSMFGKCSSLTSLDLSHFDTSKVTNMYRMFEDCRSLVALDLSSFDTARVTDLGFAMMFFCCDNLATLNISSFNTANATNLYCMFDGCRSLASLDLSHFDTSKVTDMDSMFDGCSGLTSLDLSQFDTSKVTDMYDMFYGCSSLTSLDVGHFDTVNVTKMNGMFDGCINLTNLDVGHFDTSNVVNMSWMFYGCNSITSLDVGHFDTANVTKMNGMFYGCNSITSLDLGDFDTSNVVDMSWMFYGCQSLTSLDLSHFNTSNVTNFSGMLSYCNKLNHLVLGSETKFTSDATLPENANPKIKWVATTGYNQGQKYTSAELMAITDRDQVTTYDWSKEKSLVKSSTESKTITRTINVHQPDGKLKSDRQAATISRKVDLYDDGSTVYGDWSTAQWAAYEVPVFKDYEASIKEIPAQTVTAETKDQTIDVTYGPAKYTATIQYVDKGKVVGTQQITGIAGEKIKPNYQAPAGYEVVCPPATITINKSDKQIINVNVKHQMMKTNELKSITRTINIHKPDGTIQTFNQEAILSRPVTEDLVTGQRTYGSWSNGRWDKIQIPRIKGYTASSAIVPAKTVTATTQAETVDVYYK